MRRIVLALALACASFGCQPDFPDRASSIGQGVRVLAIQSEPPEVKPDTEVQYTALVVDPSGTRPDLAGMWAFCTEPKPLSELNDVGFDCFSAVAVDASAPLGTGNAITATVPRNACREFGSDVPDPKPGEPPGRPADPDSTGGYYQPVRLLVPNGSGNAIASGTSRLQCNLPGATREVAEAFTKRYRANANPTLADVVALVPDPKQMVAEGDASKTPPLVVRAGGALYLRASWPICPATPACGDGICGADEDVKSCADDCTTPKGCGGAEDYLSYDLGTRTLLPRREAMRVSWFASAGSFAEDRTGRGESDRTNSADNTWTAPKSTGRVHLWVVLRDSRGGVAWRSFVVDVS